MKFFRPPNFFKLFEQFQKLVAFLLPIFGNVDGSWRVTSKLRDSTLIQVARKRLNVFIRFSARLVRVGDVQGVSRRHAVRGKKEHQIGVLLGGVEKVEKFIEIGTQKERIFENHNKIISFVSSSVSELLLVAAMLLLL